MQSATTHDVLDTLLTRWRAALPVRYAPAYIDGFIRRHRDLIEALVASARTRRRAERGDRPQTAAEFAAYDAIVIRERSIDADPDKAILARLATRNNLGLEYIDTRTEAILLRGIGWTPVTHAASSPLPLLPGPTARLLAGTTLDALAAQLHAGGRALRVTIAGAEHLVRRA